MKQSISVQRARCDICDKAMYDSELNIDNAYVFVPGFSSMQFSKKMGIPVEGAMTAYKGNKDFCSIICLKKFLMACADELEKHEGLVKMESLQK